MGDIKVMLNPSDDDNKQSMFPNLNMSVDSEFAKSFAHYLKVMNALCVASAHVAMDFRNLVSKMGVDISNDIPKSSDWDSLSHTLLFATSSAHSKLMPSINSLENYFEMMNHFDHTKKSVIDDIFSLLNLQYKFCVTNCERLVRLSDNVDGKELDNPPSTEWRPSTLFFQSEILKPVSTGFGFKYDKRHEIFAQNKRIALESSDKPWKNMSCQFDRENAIGLDPIHRNLVSHIDGTVISTDLIANRMPNIEIVRSPALKFLDNARNLTYSTINKSSYVTEEKMCKDPYLKNVHFGIQLPTISKTPTATQNAQLRRWSETAAHEVNDRQDDSGNLRRWSVPWDGEPPPQNTSGWHDKKCNLMDTGWSEDQDPLDMAIFLLSFKPHTQVAADRNLPLPETLHQSTSKTNNNASHGYSIWSGTDPIPFLRQPESQG